MELQPEWEYVADRVMGGVSVGQVSREERAGWMATVLRGQVSLDNNGGFVQIACDLRPDGGPFDASGFAGVWLEVCGNGERYDLRLRTDQLTRPWQSFRSAFETTGAWQTLHLPFDGFEPHKTDVTMDTARLRRIGLLAIGREFEADLAIARLGFYV